MKTPQLVELLIRLRKTLNLILYFHVVGVIEFLARPPCTELLEAVLGN
jgi:hypothetical protein